MVRNRERWRGDWCFSGNAAREKPLSPEVTTTTVAGAGGGGDATTVSAPGAMVAADSPAARSDAASWPFPAACCSAAAAVTGSRPITANDTAAAFCCCGCARWRRPAADEAVGTATAVMRTVALPPTVAATAEVKAALSFAPKVDGLFADTE